MDHGSRTASVRGSAERQSGSYAVRFGLDEVIHERELSNLQRDCDQNPTRYLLLPGVRRLSTTEADVISKWVGTALSLPDLEVATPAILERVIAARGLRLFLNGLREITPDQAQAIVEWNKTGRLYLNGLSTVSQDFAQILATWGTTSTESFLVLDGVRQISPAAATTLKRGKAWMLSMSGLSEMDAPLAEAFTGELRASLRLRRLKRLTPAILPSVARWNIKFLWVKGIEELDVAAARAIAKCKCDMIFMDGVRELPLPVAQILTEIEPDTIYLLGVRNLAVETKKHLKAHSHKLIFNRGVL